MSKYVIGIDYGTLSGRAVLIDVSDGSELASAVLEYPHGVMDECLADGITKLPPNYALQDPMDYIEVIKCTCPKILCDSGVAPEDVIGIGIDFTACTILPVWADGTPLCTADKYRSTPHAYVKLWKHHAAQKYANMLNDAAHKQKQPFIDRYGGKISSEWAVPKIWQVLAEAPELYEDCDYFIEATDWVIWQLCGVQTRNSCTAGYKAIWHKHDGYPPEEFFASLDPRLRHLVKDKLNCPVSPLGTRAGGLTAAMAEMTGLCAGTAVAVGNVDGHATVPALGITQAGNMLIIMGTSACHMLLGDKEKNVPGICGVVEDGIMPGLLGYEAGQAGFGDHYAWFMKNALPYSYKEAAASKEVSDFDYIVSLADKLLPGESGLLALDWWNGNRCVLVDADLSGLMLGMSLRTKPEEVFRALVEATAFGSRMIIENFRKNDIPINAVYAAGGIAEKNSFIMQVFADVLGCEIKISGSAQAAALGAGIFASVAAGSAAGGWNTPAEAAKHMGKVKDIVYKPDAANNAIYNTIYSEYVRLHDCFGRGENDVMKRLMELRAAQLRIKE